MPAELAELDQRTVGEFPAFGDLRPDGEKRELIAGGDCVSRDDGREGATVNRLAAKLLQPAIDARLPTDDIYRWKPVT